jgi:methyl-accepting chemotaxis protein
MDELTQQNAAMVEEAAAASQALAEQSTSLSSMMSRYKVGGDPAAQTRTTSPAALARGERRAAVRPWTKRAARPD